MITNRANAGKTHYGIKEYILDKAEDLEALQQQRRYTPKGSTAFIIETSETYMINSEGEWIPITSSSGGNNNGGNSDGGCCDFDGGSIDSSDPSIKDLFYTKDEINNLITSLYRYKGSVDSYNDLPTENQQIGDAYNIVKANAEYGVKAGDNVVWNGEEWDVLAGNIDIEEISSEKLNEILDSLGGLVNGN